MESEQVISKTIEPSTIEQLLTQGEFVYELYAILVHNGGAFGGHYFAYIKNQQDMWYNFNDSTVSPISDTELMNTFGGAGMPNTAYMLLYRKVNSSNEISPVPEVFSQ